MDKTARNLWVAFFEEAKANRIYTAFAIRAMEENHPEIAQLFFEVAGAETAHAISHLKVVGQIKSTLENLRFIVESEQFETGRVYPKMIQEALDEGRTDAAETFRLAMNREHYHLGLFTEALKEFERKLGSPPRAPSALPTTVKTEDPVAARPETRSAAGRNLSVPEVEGEKGRIATLERIREVVFGMQDGLVSTVAVAASVMAATAHRPIVFIAGLTSAMAGTIAMGTGSYLASKAEKDLHAAEIEKEARELATHPEEEMAELIELYQQEGLTMDEAERLSERVASDRKLWLKTLTEKELGLTPEDLASPTKDALTMSVSFMLGAIIPLVPYIFIGTMPVIGVSIAVTVATLFVVGLVKARVTGKHPLRAGLEVMIIGTASGLLGYLIGAVLPQIFGQSMTP
ncbi:MAG TPA: VIT1/CCC1 transporter family protein [Nitrospiria bacterium]|nr:VIT1/CCC1 transporter family protein [Nitrospiria bacterium]